MTPPHQQPENRFFVARAWFVHFYTSLGLACVLFAANAVIARDTITAVIWIAIAMFVDGTDGNMARRWNVKKWTPHFDGRKLDDIVDFLTYTFIPIFFMDQYQIVDGYWRILLIFALMSSAYGFSSESAKTDDGFFTGFPSYWNGVALYLYWLEWPLWANIVVILSLGTMTFLPTKYISMNQTRQLKQVNIILFFAWVALLLYLFTTLTSPNKVLVYISLLYPAFYFAASFYLHLKSQR